LVELSTIPLLNLHRGDKATIIGFSVLDVPAKFYTIGIVPGSTIQLYRKLPLGGAVCIKLNNTDTKIAVSRREAEIILTNKLL